MTTTTPEDRQERTEQIGNFALHLVSYRLGDRFYATVDNVDPGAVVARADAETRESAETAVLSKARERIAATRTF